jgi:hypothetical protein
MSKWLLLTLVALAILWFLLTNIGSSLALNELAARPVLALTKGGQRIEAQQRGIPAGPEQAAIVGGQGIRFGYSTVYRLPDGSLVTCRYRFRSVTCDRGWTAERAPLP